MRQRQKKKKKRQVTREIISVLTTRAGSSKTGDQRGPGEKVLPKNPEGTEPQVKKGRYLDPKGPKERRAVKNTGGTSERPPGRDVTKWGQRARGGGGWEGKGRNGHGDPAAETYLGVPCHKRMWKSWS